MNPTTCDLECHIYDYFRVASALAAQPGDEQAAADRIDLDAVLPTWRAPLAIEVGHRERTRGGVTATGSFVSLSLRLGVNFRELRRALGDSMTGAFAVAPFDRVRALPTQLGDACGATDDGRANRTYVNDL